MNIYGDTIAKLIQELSALPGIGGKSAQRLAFHIMNLPKERVQSLARAIVDAREKVVYCSHCCTVTDKDPCPICDNPKRNREMIMVVEDPRDMAAYERTREYTGLYHVLHGVISPMTGMGPSDIRIQELLERLSTDEVKEVILATNPTVEGEATALYLGKLLKPLGIRVTRIANGVPVGGDLEYVDEITLYRAFEGRRDL